MIGRDREERRVGELVDQARSGRGGALVLSGEAGIGKSALLAHAERAASGFRVLRAAGSEFEQELPYSALHQLCVPVLGRLASLPRPRREALRIAFGLAIGTPQPFQVGLAVLDLLAAVGRPVLCVVDDVQWLDSASSQAMAFLARRAGADSVAVLLALRSPSTVDALGALPRLHLGGLADRDSQALLAARHPFPLDDRVRDRLVAEANGNPLALLELPLAGGFALPAPVPSRVEEGFRTRFAALPEDARLLLTIASADPTGDPGLLWPAAEALGVGAAVADTAGLAEFGARIRFCHPLARSAVYRAASDSARRAVHGVLADATDALTAPDRRAWHRAQACAGPDDAVAADLEQAATRARSRGGVAAAAAFLDQAVALSLDGRRRAGITLAAVEACLEAGSVDRAADLLSTVDMAAQDEPGRARADLLRARIAFSRPGDESGPVWTVSAARRLAARSPGLARECFLDAIETSFVVGRAGGVVEEVLTAARALAPPPAAPDLLEALITWSSDGYRAALPMLRDVLHSEGGPLWSRRPALASMISTDLWDLGTQFAIAEWLLKAGRESGSPLLLRLAFAQKATGAVLCGDVAGALAATAEEEAVADAVGEPPLRHHRLLLAAMSGHRDETLDLLRGFGGTGHVASLHWSAALLHNGLGDHEAALTAARAATGHGDLFLTGVALPELVEAAVRQGEPAEAATALAALSDRTEAAGTDLGRGVTAYARGLVTGAEDDYREAVESLQDSPLLPYRGRAHLLYGQWLRRAGRGTESLRELRIAHDLLTESGAGAFAGRAAEELRAAGQEIGRPPPVHETLTRQQLAVARLVASGATSNEVAAQLFISKRTVDAHLRAIFPKLGVTSRRQLRDHPGLRS
ncbi:LuxR family transcriptional regulator [Lentzea sp. BCCO 10_0061]|uniref:LuxR family transcriptional regulator n=1 Tax=Lentzea sokolovensis TaxID=3095429 RepID=A0ABU4VBH9_9PSEU|nr:LuxR family transcriptional regulator [Lentzea sp. BCCO 10_0061]MDX8148712.1 LuxR family transcriptional regulator [Lentzea sp. BCCO 10_0061]